MNPSNIKTSINTHVRVSKIPKAVLAGGLALTLSCSLAH